MTQKRVHPDSTPIIPEVFKSTKIDEQTSSFVGAFSPILSAAALQRLPEFRTATHRIAAWRKPSRQQSLTPSKPLFDTGHDDDGESWAGGRLARVLNDTQVSGTVVVARWYGGQNIGPVRFTHIESCAKQAIWKWKVAVSGVEKEGASKKQRIDDETRKRNLVEELAQRDHSIFVLRKALAGKRAKLSGEEVVPVTPQKVVEYETMGLDVLKRLDKARDATIAVILKQMDKVDEDLKLLDGLDDDALDDLKERDSPSKEESSELSEVSTTKLEAEKSKTDDLKAQLGKMDQGNENVSAIAGDATGTEESENDQSVETIDLRTNDFEEAISTLDSEKHRRVIRAKKLEVVQSFARKEDNEVADAEGSRNEGPSESEYKELEGSS